MESKWFWTFGLVADTAVSHGFTRKALREHARGLFASRVTEAHDKHRCLKLSYEVGVVLTYFPPSSKEEAAPSQRLVNGVSSLHAIIAAVSSILSAARALYF